MLPECDFKNELCNADNRYYKFLSRDLEIKRACYNCRIHMDYNDCVLSKIYRQRSHTIELNELLKEIDNIKREISRLQESVNELKVQKENGKKEVATLDKEIKILDGKATRIRANDFLIATIGRENYFSYKNNGYFDVKGTNNSI